MKFRLLSPIILLPLVLTFSGKAGAAINKETTGTDLTAGASWVGGSAPGSGDVATWATGSLGGALTIGSNLAWQGIDVQAATTAITTSGAGTLTLGSSGINIASGGVDVTLDNSITVGSVQNWTVGSGRTLTVSRGKTLTLDNKLTLNGAGQVNLGGTGTTTLTGVGEIVISSGILQNNMQTGSSSAGRSGATTLSGGTISIASSINMFGTGAINLNGGAIGSFSATGRDLGTGNSVNIGGNVQIGGSSGGLGSGYVRFGGATDLGGSVRTITAVASGVFSGNGAGAIFNGKISNGGITKEGAGYLTLGNNTNDFTGAVTINAGNLAFSSKALATASSVTLANSGVWLVIGENGTGITHDINNLNGVTGSIIRSDFGISGTSTARILKINQSTNGTFAGTFTEGSSGRTIALVKTGTAKLTLSGTGGYTGGTTISQGTLAAITNGSALGASGTVTLNDTNTGSNNTALLLGNITMARPITIANQGSGTTTLGANGSAALPEFSGAITLAKDVTLDGTGSTDRLTFSGGIGGTGNVTVSGGTNRVVFAGSAANTYNGTTSVSTNSILQLGTGGSSTTSLIPDASVVTVNSGGYVKLAKGANSETIGGLSGSGTVRGHEGVTGTASSLVIDGGASQNFSGVLENGGASGSTLSLTKSGGGTQTISGTSNTYTGNTLVSGGTLVINGNISTSTLTTVQTGATIAGSGTVGALTIDGGGILAPGTSPGTLNTGTLTLAGTSISNFELNPSDITIGLGINDLVSVTGDLTLDGILNVVATSGDFLSVIEGTTWRLFNYNGSLTNNLLTLGTMPSLGAGLDWSVDTATTGQVNLVVVPEPGAALLGGLGLICLLRRRR